MVSGPNYPVYHNNDLPTNGYKGGGPHLHCLRHTFCIHSLEQMLKNDIPHGVTLQLPSAYMGHQSLSATARYLQFTVETFPDLMAVIEMAYQDLFPKIEGRNCGCLMKTTDFALLVNRFLTEYLGAIRNVSSNTILSYIQR